MAHNKEKRDKHRQIEKKHKILRDNFVSAQKKSTIQHKEVTHPDWSFSHVVHFSYNAFFIWTCQ